MPIQKAEKSKTMREYSSPLGSPISGGSDVYGMMLSVRSAHLHAEWMTLSPPLLPLHLILPFGCCCCWGIVMFGNVWMFGHVTSQRTRKKWEEGWGAGGLGQTGRGQKGQSEMGPQMKMTLPWVGYLPVQTQIVYGPGGQHSPTASWMLIKPRVSVSTFFWDYCWCWVVAEVLAEFTQISPQDCRNDW